MMSLIFKAHQTIEFIGDSITDSDRTLPGTAPLGIGYVRAIHTLLQAGYPELQLNIINKGINGDRTVDLVNRWNQDVVEVNPDWLFIYIGINDIWRKYSSNPEETVFLPDFTANYTHCIESAINNTQSQIRLISPFLAETNLDNPFRKDLADYQDVVDQLGEKYTIPVIHLQPGFDWAMLSKPFDYWTNDQVHPTEIGHMLIALTILRACGFSL